jgi:hypothetical protein
MWDLLLGLAVMAIGSLLVFRVTATVAHRLSWWPRNVLAILIVSAMVLYSRLLWQNTALAQWLPYSNLIVIGNWFPLFLAALAGVVIEMRRLAWLRRAAVVTVLGGFASFAVLLPLAGQAPPCGKQWADFGGCQQTTPYTCSPASAATLLQLHGIAATEQEMAELCLTRRGTSWLGLYRGLKLKTQGTAWDVELVRCSATEVSQHTDRPMIMEVGLEADTPIDAAFRSEFGWVPGVRHSVVLLASTDRRLHVLDPSPQIGREEWNDESLHLLWRGHGLRLVKRAP